MLVEPYTKRIISSDASVSEDFLMSNISNQDVLILFNKYKDRLNHFYLGNNNELNKSNKYYIYAWHTIELPKRYFYVGKGTNSRKSHILTEIKKVEDGKTKNERFERYKQIRDLCGIACEIIIKDLTELEALIYEQCLKFQMIDDGEVLLNIEGMPEKNLSGWWRGTSATRPTLDEDPYYSRYLKITEKSHFDEICKEDLLRTWCNLYGLYPTVLDNETNKKEIIKSWVVANNGKFYSAPSTKTKSIIIHGFLSKETYLKYREKGYKIFNANDVLNYINNN